MSQDPGLATTIREAMISALAAVHTSLPAQVVEYSSGPPAVVKVALGVDFHRRAEDGSRERYSPPQIANVPVVFPGAGGYSLTCPIAAGDTVLLVFCERSIADWLRTGGTGVEPRHARRHDLTDAVAIAGVRPRNDDIPAAGHDADAWVFRVPVGKAVKIGGGATESATTAEDVLARLNALETWASAHTHSGVAVGVFTSGPPAAGPTATVIADLQHPILKIE